MGRAASLYPPGPKEVPAKLTAPAGNYGLRVFVLLLILWLFLAVYVGLLVGFGFLIFLAVFMPPPVNVIVGGSCGLYFLFLLKGLFRRTPADKALRLEVTAEDEPRLFEFLDKLCKDTGAPPPHAVYVSPEVSAGVFYHDAVYHLLWPARRNLLIGLGLVNVLNLSEFKAVLAHELAHFSRGSAKRNGYVYMANRIVSGVVYGRDGLEDVLDWMRQQNPILAAFGHAAATVLWAFRLVLQGVLYGLNHLRVPIARDMEFNADLVAVRLTGSDALVQALARLEFAAEAWALAREDLASAAGHEVYTADLFYQHTKAAHFLRRVRKEPRLGIPPPLPDDPDVVVEIFGPDDDRTPRMWADHPGNYDREQNAKRVYVPCRLDERSAWVLFEDAAGLRERVAWRYYRVVHHVRREAVLAAPEKVQVFLDEEHAEKDIDPKYHGLYDGRLLDPGDLGEVVQAAWARPWKLEQLTDINEQLFGAALKARMEAHHRRHDEREALIEVVRGERKRGAKLTFRGKEYDAALAEKLIDKIDQELDEDQRWFTDLDRKVFEAHCQMALELSETIARELRARYEFHVAAQRLARDLTRQLSDLDAARAVLSGRRRPVDEGDFRTALETFREARRVLQKTLRAADDLRLPELKSVTAGQPLRAYLLDEPLVREFRPSAQTVSRKQLDPFLRQVGRITDRMRRVQFKSLSGILALQEEIAARWKKERSHLPEARAAGARPATPPSSSVRPRGK